MTERKIKKIILFGGSQALFNIAREIQKRNYEIIIFTEDMHLDEKINDYGTLKENIEKVNISYINTKTISPQLLNKHIAPQTLGVSICALWIFKQNTIDLFNGLLFNIHGAMLPKGRGGGGYTWKILRQDRFGGFSIHKLEEGIDTGDIVMFKEFEFPLSCRIPKDYYNYVQHIEDEILIEFLDAIEKGKELQQTPQNESFGSYWPRINTAINGYIDWNWSTEEIEDFINAFDDPYIGASTFLNEQKVHLKKCYKHRGEEYFHPFQYGIVFRIYNNNIFVATRGCCLVIKEIFDAESNCITSKIRLGDRFYTSYSYLDQAKSGRIVYKSSGLQNE